MTRPKAILAGVFTGLIGFVVIGSAAWHYLVADAGPQILSRKWFVSSAAGLDRKTLSSDVWHFPDSPLIEPAGIQRVDWQDSSIFGRDRWGYFVFYRARVTDPRLSGQLRTVVEGEPKTPPSWATPLPSWWNPEKSVSSERLTEIDLQSDDIYIEVTGADVFVYWIRAPFEGGVW